jgi:hypothetical protein
MELSTSTVSDNALLNAESLASRKVRRQEDNRVTLNKSLLKLLLLYAP